MARKLVRIAALAILFTSSVLADYDAGQRAWSAGRVDEALVEWRAAANAGDGRAMLGLGRMHLRGLGVPQDFVEAHMWLNLAASRGAKDAVKERDALEARMTPEERSEAQSRARKWQPAGVLAAGSGQNPRTPPPEAIRDAQMLLAKLGYEPGPPDEVWNSSTQWAYQSFLRDAGLPPSETLTPEALRTLRDLDRGRDTPQGSLAQRSAGSALAVPQGAVVRAAAAGNINALQAAVEGGGDVNARDQRGLTALMHAADRGYTLIVPLLLRAGADPDLRAVDGPTALFLAVLRGHIEIVEVLLEAGADTSIRGLEGMTPIKLAQTRKKHSEILELLEKHAKLVEEAQRAKKDADAFAHAKSSDTLQAYESYQSSWCPRGKFCDEARVRIDALIAERIAGKVFGGKNSKRHRQAYRFSPNGVVTGNYRGGASLLFGGKCAGTWRVKDGKVHVNCDNEISGETVAVAELKEETLVGREEYARGTKKPWTWRLSVRLGDVFATEQEVTTRRSSAGGR